MDDQTRLLRLLSLVFESTAGSNTVGMRFVDAEQAQRWHENVLSHLESSQCGRDAPNPGASAATALHMVASYWAGARDHFVSTGGHDTLDSEQLPEFAMDAIDKLDDGVRDELGAMIRRSLGLFSAQKERLVAMWIDDVAATSWRLLLERRRLEEAL